MRIDVHSVFSLMTLIAVTLLPDPCGFAGNRNPALAEEVVLQTSPPAQRTALPEAVENGIGTSSQVLFIGNVETASTGVRISAMEKKDGRWQRPFPPIEGVIGRNGFAPPGKKREGDGRTPSGIFPLSLVFGYAPSVPTKMPYRQATGDDLWVDDIHADDYNRWTTKGTTKAASFERMRRDDDRYKLGVVVEYNTNPVIKGYGSAIFFYIWQERGIPTAGCIALSETDLIRIVEWLDPAAGPQSVLGMDESVERFTR
jgi:L,D-peptidoglycan transpeptidase YkuD (ErfK/YbiS/YcfS/YnhG family)